jgi:hypothetical protein
MSLHRGHHSGVNLIKNLRKAFEHAEPKSVKKTVMLSIFLRFWDLRTQKLWVIVTTGVNFINLL